MVVSGPWGIFKCSAKSEASYRDIVTRQLTPAQT